MSSNRHVVDTTPLLGDHVSRTVLRPRFLRRAPSLSGAARFLRRASSRSRSMRDPSVLVREAAAEHIEERQSEWAYSKPIVLLDLVWNIAFVFVSVSVLIMSRKETPPEPLRLWVIGYTVQCVIHIVCVCSEYNKRYSQRNSEASERVQFSYSGSSSDSSSGSDDSNSGHYFPDRRRSNDEAKNFASLAIFAKHLESANTFFSFIWWVTGFYWVSSGGRSLTTESPRLYWLCITFLAFDVFFVVICVAAACVVGLAVCCCLPCIIAILYAVADQGGASMEDIERLPRYKFRKINDLEMPNSETKGSLGGIMTECNSSSPSEHVLPIEHAECCICLSAYDDGAELHEIPCGHHFHSGCIDKWLYMNATCPLCKFNILKNANPSGCEEV